MSGPYRFTPEPSRSPLDRRPQNPLPAQPVSFKTNVNRMKTKKWVEAKKNAYDGDDWGDYDEYDEYGASEQEPLPPSNNYGAPQGRGYAGGQRLDQPTRSFTEPHHQMRPSYGRRNSFEAGEEQRAFSASTGHPPHGLSEQPQQPPPGQPSVHPALRQASGAESDISDTPEHRRDFSPSAMIPPLQTRISPAPGSASGSPSTRFPPRKSSIGQAESPTAMSPRERAPSNTDKPLPFVRPADIYRRYEEGREKERASLDEQRPNVEAARGQNQTNVQQPMLPPVEEGMSTFDCDLRSVVDQAFTRTDDPRSVPPTPITKSDSGVSRSNTDSTSGISPIMSRVPSSATSALKARNLAGGDGSTPVIAEEASESSTPVSRPTSAALLGGTHQIPRKTSPGHSRNVSDSSLTTPNASGSPARSPVVEPRAHVPEPETAELSSLSEPPEDTKPSSSGDATTREADIADAMRTSTGKAMNELSAAEKESQTAFLESHQASTSVAEAAPRSRSESPSKGRVQELAGRFGDVSHSRRGSTQSNASRTSLQSWEKSQENSRPTSPTKASSGGRENPGTRPIAEREASFRPQLPGQWESYTTSTASPNKELSSDYLPSTNNQVSSPLEEVDLTPTTAKHSVSSGDPSKSAPDPLAEPLSDPLTALKAAGAAVGEAIQASVGIGSSANDETHRVQSHGNVMPRPLQLHREESTVSTIPPTPPAKDSPESDEIPPPPPLKDTSTEPRSSTIANTPSERPTIIPQLSMDMGADDEESDRLRKEIVASLSPQHTATASQPELNVASLQTGSGPANRESSLFPSEYESYWADGDRTSPRLSHDQGQDGDVQTRSSVGNTTTANPPTQSPKDATDPSILTRFSWENGGSGLLISKLQQTPTTTGPESTNRAENEEKIPSPAIGKATEERGLGEVPDPYSGTTQDVAGVKPEPIGDVGLNDHSPTTGLAEPLVKPPLPESDRATSPARGLHVVNSNLNPEAVDLPLRISREVSPVSDQAHPSQDMPSKESPVSAQDPGDGPVVNTAVSAPLPEPSTTSPTATVSQTSDKPLDFKEILNMKSPAERVTNYNKTREYWAHADHGLGDWVSTALSKNPDLVTQPYPQPKLNLVTSGTMRHRPTGSISLFGKHHSTSSHQRDASGASASQTPTTPTSAPAYEGSGRNASHQMQAKGKDLLHTAGVLSGKGMMGAKGLFAKGKSRFKSDKASGSEPSSREASEEPSDIGSTISETLGRISLDTTDSLKEEKRRRRFSSPFHRSSRSRSRRNSVSLPNIGSTARGSPLANTPSHSRPQSYHPPEAWSTGPSAFASTPAVADVDSPERLGVLPSPVKSTFSFQPLDQEGEVPPVPPQPRPVDADGPANVSHRLLQSVIRNSTPPASETSQLEESPAFTEPPASRAHQVEDTVAGHEEGQNCAQEEEVRSRLAATEKQTVQPRVAVDVSTKEDREDDILPQLDHQSVESKDSPVAVPTAPGEPVATAEVSTDGDNGNDLPRRSHYDTVPSASPQHRGIRTEDCTEQAKDALKSPIKPETSTDEESDDGFPPQSQHDRIPSVSFGHQATSRGDFPVQDKIDVGTPAEPAAPTVETSTDEESDDGLPPQSHHDTSSSITTGHRETSNDEHPMQDHTAPIMPNEPVASSSVKTPTVSNEVSDDDLPPQFNSGRIMSKDASVISDFDSVANAESKDSKEVSPVVSSVEPRRLNDTQEDDRQVHPLQALSIESQPRSHDVNPLGQPSEDTVEISDSSGDEQWTHVGPIATAKGEGDFSYETELLGGDISPISSHASDDEERTPTKAGAHSTRAADGNADQVLIVDAAQPPSHDQAAGESALKATPRPRQQLSVVSAYRVVHAVEYLHSQSSFSSWEQDSVALSQPGDSPHLDQHDEVEVPPRLHSPSLALEEARTERASSPEGKAMPPMGPKLPMPVVPIKPETVHEGPQQSPPPEIDKPGAQTQSESLLSKISSRVSPDSAPVSPVTPSYGPRSRPPSANRARQIPSAKASHIPVQITEEPNTLGRTDNSGAIDDDDFDLYADHNGVVKDVRDEEGRPLRVPTDNAPRPTTSSRPSNSHASKPTPLPAPMEEAPGRYSDERPMSFVWGPRDANGRPQDEINRPGASGTDQPPPLPNTRIQRSSQVLNSPLSNTKAQKPRTQSIGRLLEQPSHGDLGSKNVSPLSSYRESNKSSPHSSVSPHPASDVSPPPQASPPPNLSTRPLPDGSNAPNGHPEPRVPDQRLVQDPRAIVESQMHGWVPGQPLPQDTRFQGQFHEQGPQMPGHPSVPSTQYELQQRLASQLTETPELKVASSPVYHTKKEEKSSRAKFSSVFKGLGKSSSSAPPTSQAPLQPPVQPTLQQMHQLQARVNPIPNVAPDNAMRSGSLQSGVSDLTPAPILPTTERRASPLGSALNRPPSFSQESQISQDSTRVQVTDSRLDLRYPTNPPHAQGIPPQHVPQSMPVPPRPQNFRANTAQPPETSGKKKRFSALGNIFNRHSTTGHSFPTILKLSKEEKKAQKAQKHSSAIPMQPPPQPWPPQQPVNQHPYGAIQYGAPPVARPFPGMQAVPLQTMPQPMPQPMPLQPMPQQVVSPVSPQAMQQQSMTPISPQSMQPHGVPQQYVQVPQGYQYPAPPGATQLPPPFQRLPGVPEGSAYMETQNFAQQMQAQRVQNQSRPPTQQPSQASHTDAPSVPGIYRSAKQPESTVLPPINEYFKPDPKMFKSLPAVEHQSQQQNQYHTQQQSPLPIAPHQFPNPHGLSPSTAAPVAGPTSHVSQRDVSSPLDEPQYETPQIPAAYTHVSGAFVSPISEQGPSHIENSPQSQPYSRQYSDPQMQPISPQVSAMTQSPSSFRHYSSDSVVSAISNPSPGLSGGSPAPKPQKHRMSSITEQVQLERPWNLDLPQGATEREIVRARQRQYMEQQLAAQEQLYAERTGRSPSPRSGQSNQSTSPPPQQTQPRQSKSGGFREVLPRNSPQPYPVLGPQGTAGLNAAVQHSPSPPVAPAPVHPGLASNPASYPLPASPDPASTKSPVNPVASMMPPPPPPTSAPYTPTHSSVPDSHASAPTQEPASDHDSLYDPPGPTRAQQQQLLQQQQQPSYEDAPPADEPPPYSGPGIPNEGMDKDHPRPANSVTDATDRSRLLEPRQRQASLGILQHPQPASMAASPQRSSADMGADILRRQLYEQEERDRQERLQRAEAQRVESAREREERERARARARELERSVSGGARVGSLRSAAGSTRANASANGYDRNGSTARPVYELPADDDEPVMRATSFPGQEWVPTWYDD